MLKLIIYTVVIWQNEFVSALWNGTESVSKKEPLNVGTIEISKQASLEELKSQVLALPYFSEQGVSSIHLLRLRLMENKRLTTVLKGLNNSLQWVEGQFISVSTNIQEILNKIFRDHFIQQNILYIHTTASNFWSEILQQMFG